MDAILNFLIRLGVESSTKFPLIKNIVPKSFKIHMEENLFGNVKRHILGFMLLTCHVLVSE